MVDMDTDIDIMGEATEAITVIMEDTDEVDTATTAKSSSLLLIKKSKIVMIENKNLNLKENSFVLPFHKHLVSFFID